MNSLTMEIEKTLPSLEPESARNFELAVRAMLSMARRKPQMDESEFDRLAMEEQSMREAVSHFNHSAFTTSSADRSVTSRASPQNAARSNASEMESGVSKRRPSVTMWINSASIPDVMAKV
jgi:hypothetical protein